MKIRLKKYICLACDLPKYIYVGSVVLFRDRLCTRDKFRYAFAIYRGTRDCFHTFDVFLYMYKNGRFECVTSTRSIGCKCDVVFFTEK